MNQELFNKVKAITLRKIQEQYPDAGFYIHPVYGLCTVIKENINWQHSVASMFLREVYHKLQDFYFIHEDGNEYKIDDYYIRNFPDEFKKESEELLQVLENTTDILLFLMTRCLVSFHGRPIDKYPHLIHKS